MPSSKVKKVKIAVILDKQISGLYDVLEKVPNSDNWVFTIFSDLDVSGVFKLEPDLIIYRGPLAGPILAYLRKIDVPKLMLLPFEQSCIWDTISLEPDWCLGEDETKNSKQLGKAIRQLLNDA